MIGTLDAATHVVVVGHARPLIDAWLGSIV
jgi:hypothetical protein